MTAVEGLLFAGFGTLFPKDGILLPSVKPILLAFGCTGFCIAFMTWLTLLASASATDRLLRWWEDNKPENYKGPGVLGWAMPAKCSWPHYLAVWNLIPLVVMFAWGFVLWRML